MSKAIALALLILSLPLFIILYIAVRLESKGPFIFKQKRTGLHKKSFTIYKIRTMIKGAEKIQKDYTRLNEADGPVFKIKNDPRFTKVGKFLAKYGIDELPQLVNVLKGEMALVGPRPLPLYEATKIPNKYALRFSVLPGMTSTWIVAGAHKLGFKRWMELDVDYSKNKSAKNDIRIFWATVVSMLKHMIK